MHVRKVIEIYQYFYRFSIEKLYNFVRDTPIMTLFKHFLTKG